MKRKNEAYRASSRLKPTLFVIAVGKIELCLPLIDFAFFKKKIRLLRLARVPLRDRPAIRHLAENVQSRTRVRSFTEANSHY
jgi:hypothetical protein